MLKDLRNSQHFLFTQQSLTTFKNCPLKFKKRYMEGLKWDSFPDEKVKKRIQMGNDFHLLANRYFLGIDLKHDGVAEEYEELYGWLENLKSKFPLDKELKYLPEFKLRMVSPTLKLEANFDLLLIKDDEIEIWDWKTHSESLGVKRKQVKKRLTESLQTKVYMFMLKEQSGLILDKKCETNKISMHYWQPHPPMTVEEITYTDQLHNDFKVLLEEEIRNIYEYDFTGFDKSIYYKHCKFCEFNWYCNNERIDFQAIEEDEDFLDGLDWEGIEEKY